MIARRTVLVWIAIFALGSAINSGESPARERVMALKIYFGQSAPDPGDYDCAKVSAVTRTVPATAAVATAALKELFRGPTSEERDRGYHSWFSSGTRSILKSLRISRGTAYVDLHPVEELLAGATSSCGSAAFFAEVETTLGQFPGIKRVIMAIDGDPERFYEWMQIGCARSNDYCDKRPFKRSSKSRNSGPLSR